MQQSNNFEKILKSVISENDLSTLSLDEANDEFSKLCRAFIIQYYEKNLDNKKSLSLLNNEKNNSVLKLFNNFLIKMKLKLLKIFQLIQTNIYGIYFVLKHLKPPQNQMKLRIKF